MLSFYCKSGQIKLAITLDTTLFFSGKFTKQDNYSSYLNVVCCVGRVEIQIE